MAAFTAATWNVVGQVVSIQHWESSLESADYTLTMKADVSHKQQVNKSSLS